MRVQMARTILWKEKIASKYLVVMLNETVSFKYHYIAYVCLRTSRYLGIISKLKHYLTLSQLKQIYYSLIFPHIPYAILAWRSTKSYETYIQKVQTKQKTMPVD